MRTILLVSLSLPLFLSQYSVLPGTVSTFPREEEITERQVLGLFKRSFRLLSASTLPCAREGNLIGQSAASRDILHNRRRVNASVTKVGKQIANAVEHPAPPVLLPISRDAREF